MILDREQGKATSVYGWYTSDEIGSKIVEIETRRLLISSWVKFKKKKRLKEELDRSMDVGGRQRMDLKKRKTAVQVGGDS